MTPVGLDYIGDEKLLSYIVSRWWFQIFVIFTPIWGKDPIWRTYFSDRLKPPHLVQFDYYFSNGLKAPASIGIILPETNSQFAPENGCLEYDRFLSGPGLFSGDMLALGRVFHKPL